MTKQSEDQTPAEKRSSMTWAMRLKRVFNIDIETCVECGGDVKIIASIEDPVVIRKILAHLGEQATPAGRGMLPECCAPSHRVCEDWMSISGFSAEQIV